MITKLRSGLHWLGQREAGFGLVELMVAMMLFAILLMAAAPALVSSLRLTFANLNTAQAAKLANEEMTKARAAAITCEAFHANAERLVDNYASARGSEFSISLDSQILVPGEVDKCTDGSHPTQWFQVTVEQVGTGKVLADVRTIVAVPGLK